VQWQSIGESTVQPNSARPIVSQVMGVGCRRILRVKFYLAIAKVLFELNFFGPLRKQAVV